MRGFGGERGYGGYGSYESRRDPSETRRLSSFKEQLWQMYAEAPDALSREFIEKLIGKITDKESAQRLARYVATADPRDITTFHDQKKLGILLVCHTRSPRDYHFGDINVKQGDPLIQIHIPPRQEDDDFSTGTLQGDIAESLQLTSDYIALHQLHPALITGCTYDPILRLMERRFGLSVERISIPEDWQTRVETVFHRFVDPNVRPSIGVIYSTLEDFQQRFPASLK